MNYGFAIDTRACIGCHACSTACKSENQVPLGVHRTWVKVTEHGRYPDVTRNFQVTRCNHCQNPPCVRSCPVTAMYQRPDGIVEFDPDLCIGCKACLQACPYDAIHIDPDSGTASKCHFCAHRLDVGLEPACVVVCPEHAILAGDLDDPASEISQVLAQQPVTVRKPEQGTAPKLFYIEGNHLSLHPALENPENFMFSDVAHHDEHAPATDAQGLPKGGPVQVAGTQAGQMVQVGWNAQHAVPWHWQIPAYLVTKGLAGGIFLLLGPWLLTHPGPSGVAVAAGLLAVVGMLITSGLLLYDLERPERFLLLFTRPQWRSWVARAAWILAASSLLSGAWWAVETLGWWFEWTPQFLRWLFALPTVPLALLTGTYTAFLFAQAEGRDFWQSPATPVHMLLQTITLGALALGSCGLDSFETLASVGIIASLLTLGLGEFGVPRASELANRAAHDILWGPYRRHFWLGGIALGHVVPLVFLGLGLPTLGLFTYALGMFAYGYAYVMAPQHLPNS